MYRQRDRSNIFMFTGIHGVGQSKVSAKFGQAVSSRRDTDWQTDRPTVSVIVMQHTTNNLCRRVGTEQGLCQIWWRLNEAFVKPVSKKFDQSNPSNYHLNFLASTIAKSFEKLLNCHCLNFLESNSLSDHQYRFFILKRDQLTIFVPITLWGTLGNPMSLLFISVRLLTGSIKRPCQPNFLLRALPVLSVTWIPVFIWLL